MDRPEAAGAVSRRPVRPAGSCRDRCGHRGTQALAVLLLLAGAGPGAFTRAARADTQPPGREVPAEVAETPLARAPVVIDGETLFLVRGTSAYPAEVRARAIAERIRAVAADPSVAPERLELVDPPGEPWTRIVLGDVVIATIFEADARAEQVTRRTLATSVLRRIQEAIVAHREARQPEVLARRAAFAAGLSVLAALLAWGLLRGFARIGAGIERRFRARAEGLEAQSFRVIRARHLFAVLHGALGVLRAGLLAVLAYAYLSLTLGLFPWTRGAARSLFRFVADPLQAAGAGLLRMIPDLLVLAVIVLLTRYVLQAARAFFAGVEGGTIRLARFDREWAQPTYRIVRVVVIAFAAVVAYPYVPGSGSEAFKGISIFMGVVLSLGSSSVMASIIAGYAMTYRRAFRIGDRVKIAGVIGDVMEVRLMVTRLRSLKNEEVVIPNSAIQNEVVVNYSTLARERGLILHTTVGIGYETPWRQVEAMLLLAADRTPGVLRQPAPFVLQQALGDFAITYELNVYCADAHAMPQCYTALHRNILDVFNEYGVQIMTPAYERDPAEPKVVPREQWFAPPAVRPDESPKA